MALIIPNGGSGCKIAPDTSYSTYKPGESYWEFSTTVEFYEKPELSTTKMKLSSADYKSALALDWGKASNGKYIEVYQITYPNKNWVKWGAIKSSGDGTTAYFIMSRYYANKNSSTVNNGNRNPTANVASLQKKKENLITDTAASIGGNVVKKAATTSTISDTSSSDATGSGEEQTSFKEVITGILSGIDSSWKMDVTELTDFTTSYNTTTDGSNFFDLRNILGVFGMPYQFLPIADPRIANNQDEAKYNSIDLNQPYGDTRGIGAVFADKIISSMPILFMCPGKPAFMGEYTEDDRKTILGSLISTFHISDVLGIEDLLKGNGRYYTFKPDVAEYYKYVNPMCRIAAGYMGIAGETLDGSRLDALDWQKYTTERISAFMMFKNATTAYLSIPFYIESDTQIQDSFDNNTTDSTLASSVNSISDTAREINFLLGNIGSATDSNIIQALAGDADISSHAVNLENAVGNLLGGNKFLKNIKDHLISVATGGKLIFPKIWAGSGFSRQYDITIKLRSPDKDNLSLYFNIIVPTLHLVGFVAPHMISNDPNAFGNPFLVRCIYKGFFNVDLGIITSMNITKGDGGNWNAEGIPSTVDITFTIQDLYETMSITKTDALDWKYDTMDNTALMDYIANFCGINVYEPEIKRNLRMWFANNFTNRITDFFTLNVWGNIKQGLAWRIASIYNSGR